MVRQIVAVAHQTAAKVRQTVAGARQAKAVARQTVAGARQTVAVACLERRRIVASHVVGKQADGQAATEERAVSCAQDWHWQGAQAAEAIEEID